MKLLKHHHLGLLFFFVFNLTPGSTQEVVLVQTVPANDALVCPGGKYQCTCTSTADSSLFWQFNSEVALLNSGMFDMNNLGNFYFELTLDNGTHLVSTATDEKISSALQDEILGCSGGSDLANVTIRIADGPANCSNATIICDVRPRMQDTSLYEIEFEVLSNDNMTCVEAYQFVFNGETKDAPVNASLAVFNISNTPGQAFLILEVYTLDYEGRSGQSPCTFTIIEISEVDNVSVVSQCDPSALLIQVTWTPSRTEGCIGESQVNLRYIVDISGTFPESQSPMVVENTTYTFEVTDLPQNITMEVTIIPNLSELGLNGSAVSTHVTIAQTICETSVSLPASAPASTQVASPSSTPESTTGAVGVAIGVTVAVVMVVILIASVALVIAVILYRRRIRGTVTDGPKEAQCVSWQILKCCVRQSPPLVKHTSTSAKSSPEEIGLDLVGSNSSSAERSPLPMERSPSDPLKSSDPLAEASSTEKSPAIPNGYFDSSCAAKLGVILEDVGRDWKKVATHLGIRECDLPQEDHVDVDDSFMKTLSYSLKNPPNNAYPYKRKFLYKAVDIVKHELAEKLEEKYNNDDELDIGNLSDVLGDLHELKRDWKHLGEALSIPGHELASFCPKDDQKQKFKDVLQKWMEQKAHEATLHKLHDALIKANLTGVANKAIHDPSVKKLLKS